MGADTKANKGSGALEIRDLRLLEDGSERGGCKGSNLVGAETAKRVGEVGSERASVSNGADTKSNALGRRRTPVVGSVSP